MTEFDELNHSLSPEMGAELSIMRLRYTRATAPKSLRPLSLSELANRNARSKQFYYLLHYIENYS